MLSIPLRVLAVAAYFAVGVAASRQVHADALPTVAIERLPAVVGAASTSFVAPLVLEPNEPIAIPRGIMPVDYLTLEPPSPPAFDSQSLSQGLTDANPFSEPLATQAPSTRFSFFRDGEWYFSFGESRDFWNPMDIHISQPSLGNNFTVHSVQGHDEPDWKGGLFGSQYNVRIGRFFGETRRHGFEFSLDHTKYSSTIGQTALVTGTINGQPVNQKMVLYQNVFDYELHNGANHAMCNYVHRVPLRGELNQKFSVAGIGKLGVGAMLPHTEDNVLGHQLDLGVKTWDNLIGRDHGWWRLGGWTVGFEAGVRIVLWGPVYLELTDKVAWSSLSGLPVYQGTANHDLLMNELILSIGGTYDGVGRARRRAARSG